MGVSERAGRQTDRQMAQTHPVEEEMPKSRKTRLSQRQEGRGHVRRDHQREGVQQQERGRGSSPLLGPRLWPFLQRQIKDQLAESKVPPGTLRPRPSPW